MKAAGLSPPFISWFKSYLNNRQQRVVIPGAKADWVTIEAGVPQGSILGPLLFLIFINDIVQDIQSNIRLFADDTSLYIKVDHPISAADALNSDISKISNWANKWLVTFNPSKSASVLFSRKLNRPLHPPLIMENQRIEETEQHKHLGLTFSNNCSWHSHIEQIKNKAWKRIAILRKLKFQLDRKSLEIIYLSFIRPLLEYADVVWDDCNRIDKIELDKIQNEAARICIGATKLVSLQALHQEIGWQSLEDRRKEHRLLLMYKMKNHLCPPYLSQLIPPHVGQTTRYNLRNENNLSTIQSRTNLYHNSFLPSTIRDWNELPINIRSSTSIGIFKRCIRDNTNKPPDYYHFGPRKLQILHARLRTGCSMLKSHLFAKNVIDSPACDCGGVENVQHYFFECPFYHIIRTHLINSVSTICPPSVNVFLYGNSSLSTNLNKTIFQHVQTYIDDSKRF